MAYPEQVEFTPEHPFLNKVKSLIDNSEREIQKECLATGQPWINGFITQWNVVLGNLDLAEMTGEITEDELKRFKENLYKIYEIVDGEGGLREKYQSNNILMPNDEKEKLLDLLDVFSVTNK